MLARGSKEGPLFLWQNGCFLTRERFVPVVREALTAAGLEAANYAGHSFRIEAANVAFLSQPSRCWVVGRVQIICYTLKLLGRHCRMWQKCWQLHKIIATIDD